MVIQTGDNKFGVAKWIVDPVAGLGTHTTITGAYASASSGETIVVRPGTYTEDPVAKPGTNLVAFMGDSLVPNVTLVGKLGMTGAGTASVSNIRLQTNSDFAVAVTGSAASVLDLNNCYLNFTNNTGISYTSSSGSASITLNNCGGDLGTTGIAYFASTSPGNLIFENTFLGNSGGSTTASTHSSGSLQFYSSLLLAPVTTSGTSTILGFDSQMGVTNTTNLTVGGSGNNACSNVSFTSGTATAVSVSSTLIMKNGCSVTSSNTAAIAGAGTLSYSPINFTSSSNITTTTQSLLNIGPSASVGSSNSGGTNTLTVLNSSNTASSYASLATSVGGTSSEDPYFLAAIGSTRCYAIGLDNSDSDRFKITTAAAATNTPSAGTTVLTSDGTNIWVTGLSFDSGSNVMANYAVGTWTPTLIGTVAGTTTYTTQVGYYTRIGNLVTVFADIVITGATGTGNIVLGGLPFTVKNQANYQPNGPCLIVGNASWTWPAGSTSASVFGAGNNTTCSIYVSGSAVAGGILQMANAALTLSYTLTYQI